MAVDLLQRWASATSRECPFSFDGAGAFKVDASAVCHEVRGVRTAPGEKVFVSFCDESAGVSATSSTLSAVGELCHMTALKPDVVVTLRVWACRNAAANGSARGGGYPGGHLVSSPGGRSVAVERRSLGEVRVPFKSIVSRCDGALYHTWLLLSDTGNLTPNARSIGDEEAFSQALQGGRQQLLEPKVCVSILRTAELGGSTRVLWTSESPKKDRIAHWGPLLRSQEQHEAICVLEFKRHASSNGCQDMGAARTDGVAGDDRLAALEKQAAEQAVEVEALKHALQHASSGGSSGSTAGVLTDEEERRKEHLYAERLRQEHASLHQEIEEIGEQVNGRITSANEQIRALRAQRDDAIRVVEKRSVEHAQLLEERGKLARGNEKLSEQKEALLRIVEDLHQAVANAGMGANTLRSMEGILGVQR